MFSLQVRDLSRSHLSGTEPSRRSRHRGRCICILIDSRDRPGMNQTKALDPVESAQAVWSAVHGAVTIEQAKIGQTTDPAASYEHMLDLLVVALFKISSVSRGH
ncbi:MAG: TetR-like C-terminal domain-containing protein [Mycobacterium sp.]